MAGFALGQLPGQLPGYNATDPSGISFASYKAGIYSGIEKPTAVVIQTQTDLQGWWPILTGEHASKAPKDINWTKQRLVLVALGQKPTGGYRTFVKSIRRKDQSNLVVEYIEKQPPAGMPVTTVITSPWEIVRMDRTAGNFVFEKQMDNGMGGIIVIDANPKCGCKCGCPCCK